MAAWLTTYITDDRDEGVRQARAWLATMLSIPRQGGLLLQHAGVGAAILAPIRAAVSAYPHAGDRSLAASYVPVEAAERMTIIGDAAAARSRIVDYRAAGVQLPVLSITALRALFGS